MISAADARTLFNYWRLSPGEHRTVRLLRAVPGRLVRLLRVPGAGRLRGVTASLATTLLQWEEPQQENRPVASTLPDYCRHELSFCLFVADKNSALLYWVCVLISSCWRGKLELICFAIRRPKR